MKKSERDFAMFVESFFFDRCLSLNGLEMTLQRFLMDKKEGKSKEVMVLSQQVSRYVYGLGTQMDVTDALSKFREVYKIKDHRHIVET